jgi:PadR family transcriptional regulator AphA
MAHPGVIGISATRTAQRKPSAVAGSPDLSLNQWLVLATVAEGPTHGFAIASLVGTRGELGQVWTIPRPLVYRALDDLVRLGLVQSLRTEPGANNVTRTVVGTTPAGLAAARAWLDKPVDHVRDVRSILLVKLALLSRSGRSPRQLLEAEQQHVAALLAGLQPRAAAAGGFNATLLRWRLHQATSVQRFLADELRAAQEPSAISN